MPGTKCKKSIISILSSHQHSNSARHSTLSSRHITHRNIKKHHHAGHPGPTLFAAVAVAAPTEAPNTSLVTRASRASIGERPTFCGVYICDCTNFDGNCYWACYPISTKIVPDDYFRSHAGSFGPDEGCSCYPQQSTGGNCDVSTDKKGIQHYPGGDPGNCINDLASFYYNAQ
ncbi:hypothetical protein GQ53DRAFT_847516 [Thozetella sp. PMI_491]|nr:hypothetical protein GQ53DRAFT_847516 [Thozetella sp. PMI_491]